MARTPIIGQRVDLSPQGLDPIHQKVNPSHIINRKIIIQTSNVAEVEREVITDLGLGALTKRKLDQRQ